MRTEMKYSELLGGLDPNRIADMEPAAPDTPVLSAERIKALALARLETHHTVTKIQQNEGKPMKKTLRVLLIAAIVAAIPLTVLAAVRGADIYRALFGDSVALVEDQIQDAPGTAIHDNYRLAVESLLTDGYVVHMVASLTDLEGGRLPELDLRADSADLSLNMASSRVLDEFSTEATRYYLIELGAQSRFERGTLRVSVDGELPLAVSVTAENRLRAITLEVPAGDFADSVFRVDQIQFSHMGFMLIGSETRRGGGLPAAEVHVLFADGGREALTDGNTFDDEDDGQTIMGGGSAVIVDDYSMAPLVLNVVASRNPDGEVVTAGTFSRIVDLDAVTGFEIDGVVYSVK